MRTVLVAAIAATPPTVGAFLTYVQARAARRFASRDEATTLAHRLDVMAGSLDRVELTVGRIDGGVADLRERVARLEGASRWRLRA